MASTLDIKRRIKSVNSTAQITKAMKLVATSKLQKARNRVDSIAPFFDETKRVVASIINGSKGVQHPFITERPVKRTLIIALAGDKGLCGGYNSNICKVAYSLFSEKEDAKLVAVGKRSRDFFKRRAKDSIAKEMLGVSEKPEYANAKNIGAYALSKFASGEVDEVYLCYTRFKSIISHEPMAIKLLPVDTSEFTQSETEVKQNLDLMLYEPIEEEALSYIIPKYINTMIFGAMAQASACELGARMTAMDSATDNAMDMIGKLTLKFNRARQGAITQEITEIVSGANALG